MRRAEFKSCVWLVLRPRISESAYSVAAAHTTLRPATRGGGDALNQVSAAAAGLAIERIRAPRARSRAIEPLGGSRFDHREHSKRSSRRSGADMHHTAHLRGLRASRCRDRGSCVSASSSSTILERSAPSGASRTNTRPARSRSAGCPSSTTTRDRRSVSGRSSPDAAVQAAPSSVVTATAQVDSARCAASVTATCTTRKPAARAARVSLSPIVIVTSELGSECALATRRARGSRASDHLQSCASLSPDVRAGAWRCRPLGRSVEPVALLSSTWRKTRSPPRRP